VVDLTSASPTTCIKVIAHVLRRSNWRLNQPITATVTNAEAGLSWLAAQPPNLEQVRLTLDCIVSDGLRAGDVTGRIRALVKKAPRQRVALEIMAVLEVIALTRVEVVRGRSGPGCRATIRTLMQQSHTPR